MLNRFALTAVAALAIPFAATSPLALADPDPAVDPAADPGPPPDNGVVASADPGVVTTPDGWTLTVVAKDETQLPIAPLTTAVSSREYLVGGTFTGTVTGGGKTTLAGGSLEAGYQIETAEREAIGKRNPSVIAAAQVFFVCICSAVCSGNLEISASIPRNLLPSSALS